MSEEKKERGCNPEWKSKKNKYYIPKNRIMELKYFCLQYNDWKHDLRLLSTSTLKGHSYISFKGTGGDIADETAERAVKRQELETYIKMVEDTALSCDKEYGKYILKAVTEDLSFVTLSMMHGIDCNKNTYYDRLHKFFWMLSRIR